MMQQSYIHMRRLGFAGAILLLTLAAAVGISAPARAAGEQAWVARYNGPGNFLDVANDVVVSSDGARVYVTGLSDGKGPLFAADFATIAYDALTGDLLWVARYNGPGRGWDSANSLALSPSGTVVFVTGGSGGEATGHDFATVAYDALTGAQLWVARTSGPGSRLDSAQSVAVSSDGARIFVTGYSERERSKTDYLTVAYDATSGQELWRARYDGPAHGRDYAFVVTVSLDDEALFVTGWNAGHGEFSADAATVSYDALTGAERWVARYDGPNHGADAAYSLALDPAGASVYVAGQTYDPSSEEYGQLTIGYEATTGAEQWVSTLVPPGGYADASSIVVSPDGARVLVTGGGQWRRHAHCYARDFTTVAYDTATGSELWAARYNGPAAGEDYPTAIALSSDGSQAYVVGESAGFGGVFGCRSDGGTRTGQDYATVAYDTATGSQLWVARYDTPKKGRLFDVARAVDVGPDGGVFVTGESGGGGYRDYVTIRYEGA